jgi:hypothetical protein
MGIGIDFDSLIEPGMTPSLTCFSEDPNPGHYAHWKDVWTPILEAILYAPGHCFSWSFIGVCVICAPYDARQIR